MNNSAWHKEWAKRWHAIWLQMYKPTLPSPKGLEPLELLTAAFVYHVNAVTQFPDARLHVAVADSQRTSAHHWLPGSSFFSASQAPLFCQDIMDDNMREFFGGMHLASASFTLSTALYLLAKGGAPPWSSLLKGDQSDWDRNERLLTPLQEAKTDSETAERQGCAKEFVEQSDAKALCRCLAMVVAHRDGFSHCDVGTRGRWKKDHASCFLKIRRCGLVEAQLNLIDVGLSQVERIVP